LSLLQFTVYAVLSVQKSVENMLMNERAKPGISP